MRAVRIERHDGRDGYRGYVGDRPAGPVHPITLGEGRAFDRALRDAGLLIAIGADDAAIVAQDGPIADLGVRVVPGL